MRICKMCGKTAEYLDNNLCRACLEYEQPITASPDVLNALENPVKGDLSEPQSVMELLQECRAVLNHVLEHGTMGLEPARILLLKLSGIDSMPIPSQVVLPREISSFMQNGIELCVWGCDTEYFAQVQEHELNQSYEGAGETPDAALLSLAAALKEKDGK